LADTPAQICDDTARSINGRGSSMNGVRRAAPSAERCSHRWRASADIDREIAEIERVIARHARPGCQPAAPPDEWRCRRRLQAATLARPDVRGGASRCAGVVRDTAARAGGLLACRRR
jgi:hypothetical protein